MERETAYIIDEMHKLGISLTEQQSEQLYEYYRLLVEWRVLRGRAETFCGQFVDCEGKKYE